MSLSFKQLGRNIVGDIAENALYTGTNTISNLYYGNKINNLLNKRNEDVNYDKNAKKIKDHIGKDKSVEILYGENYRPGYSPNLKKIYLSDKKNDPAIIAHEYGHHLSLSTPKSIGYSLSTEHPYSFIRSISSLPGIINMGDELKMKKRNALGRALASSIHAIGHGIRNYEEYNASKKGLSLLEDLGASSESDKDVTSHALNSYLLSSLPVSLVLGYRWNKYYNINKKHKELQKKLKETKNKEETNVI